MNHDEAIDVAARWVLVTGSGTWVVCADREDHYLVGARYEQLRKSLAPTDEQYDAAKRLLNPEWAAANP